jgi:hypothetical protein
MMGTTVFKMRDAAGGKIMLDSVTKKVQVTAITCEHCGTGRMPHTLRVSISNLTDVTCCDDSWNGIVQSWKSDGVAAALNGNSYDVPHKSSCNYYLLEEGSAGDYGQLIRHIGTNDCSSGCVDIDEFYYYVPFSKLYINLDLTATGIDIDIRVWVAFDDSIDCWDNTGLTSGYCYVFKDSLVYGGGEDCGHTSAVANSNDWTICKSVEGFACPCANTGQVTILGIP